MSGTSHNFADAYGAALEGHLLRSGEQALHHAYELGRQALVEGLGLLDVTLFHHGALANILRDHPGDPKDARLEFAADFLAECLSPFEMTLLGYKEANSRLIAAHEQLRSEIEERKKAEEALVHAKKLQAVGLLAGGVAHHFNNLLTVVLGNLDLALNRVSDERVLRMLRAAEQGAEHGAEITRHLLSFSRQQMLQPQVIDTAAWLHDIERLLSGSLRGDIAVETALEGQTSSLAADRSQLDLAILNLAVNARDAMPDGGVLRITVRDEQISDGRLGLDGQFVAISVSDTGQGIAPEIQAQIFEPFFTTKGVGPGTGLGLSQVHGFTHQSGGGVELTSRPGSGTVVRLFLPATKQIKAPHPSKERVLATGTGNVLVVEDDHDVANVASELLESLGYSVKHAYRAEAALDMLRNGEQIDLVFSDIIMPGGINGVEMAEEIRRNFPAVPVLLTSGYNDAIEKVNATGLSFIVKPYRTDELTRKIQNLLQPTR